MTTSSDAELAEQPGRFPVGKASPTRRFNWLSSRYKWMLILPLALLPVIWLVSSRNQPAEKTELKQALPVETTVLEAADSYSTSRAYTGELIARRSSDLGFERAGKVVSLLVDEGDLVEAGMPLAQLDTRDLEVQRQQLEAQKRQFLAQLQELETGPRREDIASAEAAVSDLSNQLELARLQEQRRAELFSKGAVSREEWDERRFEANAIADRLSQARNQLAELQNGTRREQVAAQVAQVDQIDAQIEAIDISLDKSVLLAPFAGEVSQRAVDEGAVIGDGQTAISLVENSAVEARIGVPVEAAKRLVVGSSQLVKVGDRTYAAVVAAKLPAVEQASQTVTVVLEMQGGIGQMVMGETARLIVNQRQAQAGYWVPSTGLIAGDRGLWSVYVLSDATAEGYRVARRDVEVLYTESDAAESGDSPLERQSQRAFIRGLVEAGDRVITSGTHKVVNGQRVTLAGE